MQPNHHDSIPSSTAAVHARLSGLSIGPSAEYGPLRFVALLGVDVGRPPMLGTDALKTGDVVVEELSSRGVVAELRARNAGEAAVLFLLGDELLGGKQHRVVNTHVLIRSGREVVVPVSCIEAGRWGGVERTRTGTFFCRRQALSVHGDLRSRLARQTRSSLLAQGRAWSDQGEVWREVDRFSSERGVRSRTSALSDALPDFEADEIPEMVVPGQVGFVAWAGDRLAGLELFGSASTLQASFQRLLRSTAATTRTSSKTIERPVGAAQELLAHVGDADWRPFAGVGDGVELRGTVDGAEVVSLVAEDALVALSVLAA